MLAECTATHMINIGISMHQLQQAKRQFNQQQQ
jgi:hypothetical protein